jgi:ethanolamine ammonia-lyase small subunit
MDEIAVHFGASRTVIRAWRQRYKLPPRRGRSDAERNCISNIRPGGLGTVEAARKLLWLVAAARRLGATGVALKDEEQAALDAPQVVPALPQS